jgi:DNA-binding XRE family transcriptional regulator
MSSRKMSSSLKEIRERLGLNQAQLGDRIGRSWQSVQAYERGTRISPPARKAIIELAEQAGLGDLVDDFLAECEERTPAVQSTRPSCANQRWHELLEQILTSGKPEAIRAVQANLDALSRLARPRRTRGSQSHPA